MSRCIVGVISSDKLRERERAIGKGLLGPGSHAKADLEHADPKDLVASIRAREQDVMRLLTEIEALVSEV